MVRRAAATAVLAVIAVLLFFAYCLLVLGILLLANVIPSW